MSGLFRIEKYTEGDCRPLAGFAATEYAGGAIADEKFLSWEYFQNPAGSAEITVAIDQDENIASQYIVIPARAVINSQNVQGSLSLNTLTGEAYRGKGLFLKTASETYKRCVNSGIHFTIGVPNKNSFPVFTSMLGFTHVCNLNFLIKPLKPFAMIVSRAGPGNKKKGEEIIPSLDQDRLSKNAVSLFDPEADGNLYEEFLQRWVRDKEITLDRSAEYLSWRYMQNPKSKYYLLKHTRDGRMDALIVFRTLYVYGMRTCVLMELSFDRSEAGKNLLHAAGRELKNSGIHCVVGVTANTGGEFRLLRLSGFMNVPEFLLPQQLPFIVRVHTAFKNSEMLFDPQCWYFTFGDYDIF